MTAALCCRCRQPLACTLSLGEIGLHAACSHAATDEAWRALDARKRPLAEVGLREATYRVVGVNRGRPAEVVAAGLSETAAEWEANARRNSRRNGHGKYARYLVEPEE